MKRYYEEYIIYTRNNLEDSTTVMVGYSSEIFTDLAANDRITDIRVVSQMDLIKAYENSNAMPKPEPKFKVGDKIVFNKKPYIVRGIDSNNQPYQSTYCFISESTHTDTCKMVRQSQLEPYEKSNLCFKSGDLFIINPRDIGWYEDVTEGKIYEVKYVGQMGEDLVFDDDTGCETSIELSDIVRVELDRFHSHTLCDGEVKEVILYKNKGEWDAY